MSINNKRSYTEYTVAQPTTDFAIGFDDFDEGGKDNILVTLNGVLVESLGYAAIRKNESTVSITPAITEGTVRLTRETDIDEPFHKFTAGALFSAKSMDENFQQVRHSQQEVRDGFVFLEHNTNGIIQEARAATGRANDAADVVADLVVGKVRAQDVSTDYANNQEEINKAFSERSVSSIAAMQALPKFDGNMVFVKGLQGGTFVYDSSKSTINDGGLILNGWVRQLDRNTATPEMFGAKGDGVTDDATALRKCFETCSASGVKSIILTGKYLIDSAFVAGYETLLIMYPNTSYIGMGGAEFIVGASLPDKFIIFSAVQHIITVGAVGNVIVSGIKFRGVTPNATDMTAYTSNLAIHTFGLNNVLIRDCVFDDLDLSNVIACGIRYEGIDYGSNVTIENNQFLGVVADNVNNIDHSSLYMEAVNSVVRNNTFKSKSVQTRKVACAVEIHASNVYVHNNTCDWYSRFAWLASIPKDVIGCHIDDNIVKVSNHAVIITSGATTRVANCSISRNYVSCEHATSETNFVTHQGLAVSSGTLGQASWTPVSGLLIESNMLYMNYATQPQFATMINFDQQVSALINNNTVYGAVAGVNVMSFNGGGGFTNNTIYNQISPLVYAKDFFIQLAGTDTLDSASISGNKFKFNATNKPAYLVGLGNIRVDGIVNTSIIDNKYLSTHKPLADLFFSAGINLGINGNVIDVGIYNAIVDVPALVDGVEKIWTQSLTNNYNGMSVEFDINADSRFYPIASKNIAIGSSVYLRVKGLSTQDAFTVLATARIKTK